MDFICWQFSLYDLICVDEDCLTILVACIAWEIFCLIKRLRAFSHQFQLILDQITSQQWIARVLCQILSPEDVQVGDPFALQKLEHSRSQQLLYAFESA